MGARVGSFLTAYAAVRIVRPFLGAVKILTMASCTRAHSFACFLQLGRGSIAKNIRGLRGYLASEGNHDVARSAGRCELPMVQDLFPAQRTRRGRGVRQPRELSFGRFS